MTKITSEYERYQTSNVMKKLAKCAHGENYREQTSSATYDEIVYQIKMMNLSPENRILDAGCGNGAFSIPLAENYSFNVEGIDLSHELIKEASIKANRANLMTKCHFTVGDFTMHSSFPVEKFELIMCIGSLYWGQSLSNTFATWNKTISNNGWMLLFLNLLYKPLSSIEKTDIGSTQFIPAIYLEEELIKSSWVVSEWSDGTRQYIEWLERWCEAMEKLYDDIVSEMGEQAALKMKLRFTTYYNLAQRLAVKRIIVRAKHDKS